MPEHQQRLFADWDWSHRILHVPRFVGGREQWHESQQLRELKGGGVELKLKLSSLMEIERQILSWGGDAKVLKPRELVEAVRKSAEAILKQCA